MKDANQGIQLIVGLGNPGGEYEQTRHNAGFWFIERLTPPSSLRVETKFFAKIGKTKRPDHEIWTLEPLTFMNRSGQAVSAFANFFRIPAQQILVVHDELDLPPGDVRLKRGGGTGGHNGLKDIHAKLGTPDYWRLRVGIGHPRQLSPSADVADFVLNRPRREEQTMIDSAIDRAVEVLPFVVQGNFELAMQKLHAR